VRIQHALGRNTLSHQSGIDSGSSSGVVDRSGLHDIFWLLDARLDRHGRGRLLEP
jgi:hypothetical protein